MADYILDKVVHYGSFKKNLDMMVDIMRSEQAGSLVVFGVPGVGKRTLIEEAQKLTNARCVYVSSHFYSDDYTAMKAIAQELGFKTRGAHITDLMSEIKESSSHDQKKLIIVLLDFEEFCRKRQSLLYNLMNLIHTNPAEVDKGVNLNIIGLTVCLDWAENIEKRVRSRLNAKVIHISTPYENAQELIEFVSELLDGYKIDKEFRADLKYLYYMAPFTSLRSLKKYLSNICDLDKKGKIVVRYNNEDWRTNYQTNLNNMLRERLRVLTNSQLDLLKFAVNYCWVMSKHGFSLYELGDYAIKKEKYKTFMPDAQLTLWDLALLLRLKLVKPAKHDQPLSQEAVFYPAVTFKQFRMVLEGDDDLQHAATDHFWRVLK